MERGIASTTAVQCSGVTGRSAKKRSLITLVLAGSLATATVTAPTQAHARWGWGGVTGRKYRAQCLSVLRED
jgi:hypothetical protein